MFAQELQDEMLVTSRDGFDLSLIESDVHELVELHDRRETLLNDFAASTDDCDFVALHVHRVTQLIVGADLIVAREKHVFHVQQAARLIVGADLTVDREQAEFHVHWATQLIVGADLTVALELAENYELMENFHFSADDVAFP